MNNISTGARICIQKNRHYEAISLLWIDIRRFMFSFLDKNAIMYDSTDSAIFNFIKNSDNFRLCRNIIILYNYIILIEYANDSKAVECAARFCQIALEIFNDLGIDGTDDNFDESEFSAMLISHIDDCRWSAAGHFKAAERYENIVFILAIALFLLAAISSALNVSGVLELLAHLGVPSGARSALIQIVGLAITGLSALNAANDLKNRLEKHRTIANKYITMRREAEFIHADIQSLIRSENGKDLIKERVSNFKNVLNSVTQDAPQIPKWAFQKVKKEFK